MVKRIAPLLALVLLLAGCKIRFDSRIDVNADESGTFAIEVSMDEELRQLMEDSGEEGLNLEDDLGEIPTGWTIEEFSSGEFEGFRIAVDFASFQALESRIDELNESSGQEAAPGFLEQAGLTREGDTFRFSTTLTGLEDELSGLGGEDAGFEGIDPSAFLGDLFEIRFVVTLPGTVSSHNADSIDGNTLTWVVGFSDEGRTLQAESTTGATGLPIGLILGIAAALAALVVVIVLLRARSRRSEEHLDGWAQPATEARELDEDPPVAEAVTGSDPWAGDQSPPIR